MNYVFEDIKRQFTGRSMLARIIIVNGAVFLVTVLVRVLFKILLQDLDTWAMLESNAYFLGVPADLKTLLFRPWTILTHMFTHFEFWHLFWNMLWLYFMGSMLIQDMGNRMLLSTYLLGGFAGFVLYVLMFNVFAALPTSSVAVGASAAVFAIVTTIGAYAPNRKLNLFGILPVKLWVLALVFVLRDVMELQSGNNIGGHLAHLGGAIFGYIQGKALVNGRDLAAGFERFLDRFFDTLKGGNRTRMKVIRDKKSPGNRSARGRSDEEYNRDKFETQQQIDRILDKISKSGYDSLSKFEKDFLRDHGS